MTHRTRLRAFALTGSILAMTQGAFAIEPKAVADRLKEMAASQGLEMTFTGVAGDSSNMTIQGVNVSAPGEPQKLVVGDIQLAGAAENNGQITIDTLTVPPYSFSDGPTTISTSPLVSHKVVLHAANEAGPFAGLSTLDSMEMKSLAVTTAGKPTFSIGGIHVEAKAPATADATFDVSAAADEFTADLSNSPDPQAKAVIEQLGYQTLNGHIAIKASWKPSDGNLVVDHYDIAVDKAGTLGLSFDIGGYTAEFMKSVREMEKKMAATQGQDQSAQGLAMLGLMQQITLKKAAIRFDDDSLTGKVLDLLAKQQGAKPSDLVNQVKAILPFGLAQLNNPQLAAAVTDAVGKFLDNPKSIEIKAEPAQPLPVAQIVAAGSTNPMSLPQVLGVSVIANDK